MAYVAAGLDPARFWEITPRLLDMEFRGAKARSRRERELVWFGAMLPHLKKSVSLEEFLGAAGDQTDRAKQFHAAWDRAYRALRR